MFAAPENCHERMCLTPAHREADVARKSSEGFGFLSSADARSCRLIGEGLDALIIGDWIVAEVAVSWNSRVVGACSFAVRRAIEPRLRNRASTRPSAGVWHSEPGVGNLAFIGADGSLRSGHEAFNEY